ncbi:MAG: hypothetical protein ACI8PT_004961, partial [Gammaproteobacteria bacterium]
HSSLRATNVVDALMSNNIFRRNSGVIVYSAAKFVFVVHKFTGLQRFKPDHLHISWFLELAIRAIRRYSRRIRDIFASTSMTAAPQRTSRPILAVGVRAAFST